MRAALWAIIRILKLDKWARDHRAHFAGVALGVALCVAWFVTGSLVRGFWLLVAVAALVVFLRVFRWVERRVAIYRDRGMPLSPLRMTQDVFAERAEFAAYDEKWAKAMTAQKVSWDGKSPTLKRKSLTVDGSVRASVNAADLGGDLHTINRLAADGTLAGIMDCKEVTVNPSSRSGKASLTFWKTPPLSGRDLVVADLPASGKGRVSFAFAAEGGAASFRNGLSVLAVSATGGGKSVLFKNAFIDMRRDGYDIEMYFINPKIVEFAAFKALAAFGAKIGNIKIAGYAETPDEAAAMCKTFHDGMRERQQRLADMGLVELKHPTEDFPARMIVCDEMADVKEIFAKIDMPAPLVISKGRATMDSVFGLAQLAKIETLGTVRDNFALRAGMRMMTPENTKAALGISENDGAPCSRIPLNMPGTGYYVTEDGTVGKFRTGKVTDEDWAAVLAGGLPAGMPVNVEDIGPPCWGYIGQDRWADRKGSTEGYVGIAEGEAKDLPVVRRRKQHRAGGLSDIRWCHQHERVENWWNVHIRDTRLEVVGPFPSRSAAKVWEERTIRERRPRWNIQHNGGNPDSNAALAKRAGVGTRVRDARREYVELARDVWSLRRVLAGFRKRERVAAQVAKRDRFMAAPAVSGEWPTLEDRPSWPVLEDANSGGDLR